MIGIFALIFFSISLLFINKEWSFTRTYGSLVNQLIGLTIIQSYNLEVYSKIIQNTKPGLPTKHLFVSKNNLDKLLSKFPDSTKKCKKVLFLKMVMKKLV